MADAMGERHTPSSPGAAKSPEPTPELLAYSQEMIALGSKSFARAASLMPQGTRDSVHLLYAWCRHCDDVVDDQHLGFRVEKGPSQRAPEATEDLETRVARLRRKTRRACAPEFDGGGDLPFEALAIVAARHRIPARFALDLIDGFAMDAAETDYPDIETTLAYCYHVAGAVGVMMAMVMDVRDRPTLQRACDLGIAFQLTNIARDVIADFEAGRVYLPGDWLAEEGLDSQNLARPQNREALYRVVSRLLDLADRYYDSAGHGIARLPWRCAWSIAAARRIYRAIGDKVRDKRDRAWDARTTTSRLEKLSHVSAAAVEAARAIASRQTKGTAAREDLWSPPALETPPLEDADLNVPKGGKQPRVGATA